jgi:hypothetical protein
MKRSDFCAFSGASVLAARAGAVNAKSLNMRMPAIIAGVKIPDSYAAKQATAQAQDVEDPQLFRHSARSFVFAELIASAKKIKHDAEIVYVSAILHDIGLTKEHATPHLRFEIDGANLAKKLLAATNATAVQSQVAWDAVVLHSMFDIARYKEPEVNLVSAGVITDVGAAFVPYLDKTAVQDVLTALPRQGFNAAFLAILTDYAHRKTDTVGGTFVEDIAIHTVHGYARGDFYQALKMPDPFTKFGFT